LNQIDIPIPLLLCRKHDHLLIHQRFQERKWINTRNAQQRTATHSFPTYPAGLLFIICIGRIRQSYQARTSPANVGTSKNVPDSAEEQWENKGFCFVADPKHS
jgi:hypothetical protein